MNLSEINWDFNYSGNWPLPVKIAVIVLVSLVVGGGGVYFDILDRMAELEAAEKQEPELKTAFELKQKKAVNLESYKEQLAEIEDSLGEMLKQMPTQEEVASLLVDITQTGLASGLEFRLFRPGAPINKDFYSELPISIQVVGKYDELGLFVSGLASLPRIVTVHDVRMSPADKKSGEIIMDATVKTYNEANNGESSGSGAKKRRGQK